MRVSYEDWKRLNLKVGVIEEVKDHPDADKLYLLKVNAGSEEKNLVAGIKKDYTKKELIGKKIIVFCNLEPAELRGVKSDGMLLAAVKHGKVVLISPEKDIEVGSKIE